MGWLNAPYRPHEVIHNIKHPITGEKLPHIVTSIPSYGEDRIYAKEQALIDLVRAELEQNRPCVIYIRQTATRDIQPRIESLIRQHVPDARTFILKNTVEAERREAVIEAEVAKGTNVVISNPELVKTGSGSGLLPDADLLRDRVQSRHDDAGSRTVLPPEPDAHPLQDVLPVREGTMEQTAVQLMSRKQRAAKLLTGDIGLTGLDALTEGEGGFEEALLEAIGRDEALLDPSELFKKSRRRDEIDAEDAAYWNVETEVLTADAETVPSDPLLAFAEQEFEAVVTPIRDASPIQWVDEGGEMQRLAQVIGRYLDTVHILADEEKRTALQARLCSALVQGVIDPREDKRAVMGMCDPEFLGSAANEEKLTHWVRAWLTEQRVVFHGCEDESAAKIVALAKQALGLLPVEIDVFTAQEVHEDSFQADSLDGEHEAFTHSKLPSTKPKPTARKRKIIDLTQVPEFERVTASRANSDDVPMRQLALF